MVAAIAGLAISAYGAYSATKGQDKALKQQQHATDEQAQVAREQLDFGKEQYNDWTSMYMPVLNDVKTMAYEKREPDYASIIGDVNTAFDTSQAMNRRQMDRYGIAPTDGAAAASEVQYGLGRARAAVGGQMQARRTAENDQWNRLTQFLSSGTTMQQTANSTMNNGFGALGSAFGNQTNIQRNMAGQYGAAAAAGASGFGRGLQNLASTWGGGGNGGYKPSFTDSELGLD